MSADRRQRRTDIYEILVATHVRGGSALPLDEDMTWRPATDAYETEDAFVIQMELAGMDPAGIEIAVEGGALVISGVRQEVSPPGKKHYHKMEISVGPFRRSIALPAGVRPEAATARYQDGFLFVVVPRGDDRPRRRRRITVA